MTRYFIRVRNRGSAFSDDDEPQEFASFDQVRHEAIRAAREILSEAIVRGEGYTAIDQEVVVLDENGQTVFAISMRDAAGLPTSS